MALSPFIKQLFQAFADKHVLVVGDVMLDVYMQGSVVRISPEAPVPVVDVDQRDCHLGGAANVALSVATLGAKVSLCSVIGEDDTGKELAALLADSGIEVAGVLSDPVQKTTRKTRVISQGHHLLRIDEERPSSVQAKKIVQLQQLIQAQLPDYHAIILQDYDKGLFSPPFITQIITLARSHNVPVIVDPKHANFYAYVGATLFKPNLKELEKNTHFVWKVGDMEALGDQVTHLRKQMQLEEVLVTLSEHGMYMQKDTESQHVPAHFRQIVDISGAGDAAISVAALCTACGLDMADTLTLTNLAGGLVCESVGVVPIVATRLAEQASRLPLFSKRSSMEN